MWRFLLFIGIITYILYKVGSFFFKIGAASQQMRQREKTSPDGATSKNARSGKIKGGDYVDYEEVK